MGWFRPSKAVTYGPAQSVSDPHHWLINGFGTHSHAGRPVTENSSLSISAVWASIRVLSETLAQVPLMLMERTPQGGKNPAYENNLFWLLHDEANPHMTSFVFRETIMGHVVGWGNGYAEIDRDSFGNVLALWPLLPDRTWPVKLPDQPLFYNTNVDGKTYSIPARNMLHIPGLGFDGYQGYSPIKYAANAMGVAIAAEEFGAKFFANGASGGTVLEHPGVGDLAMPDEAVPLVRKSFEDMNSGLDNAHRVKILREGMTLKQLGIPPNEAQFLETRKFQVVEIARFYRVQLHKLQELERATFSNIEQLAIEFVVDTMTPYFVRWEQELNRKLFNGEDRKKYYTKFNLNGLQRGDSVSRSNYYKNMVLTGIMTRNEARALEDWNRIEGLDEPLQPMNMGQTGDKMPGAKLAEITQNLVKYGNEMKALGE
jgi:HK97 family phage portal protein